MGALRLDSRLARLALGLGIPLSVLTIGRVRGPEIEVLKGIAVAVGASFFCAAYLAANLALEDEEEAPGGWDFFVFAAHVVVVVAWSPAAMEWRNDAFLVWLLLALASLVVGALMSVTNLVNRSRVAYLFGHLPLAGHLAYSLWLLAQGVEWVWLTASGLALAGVLFAASIFYALSSAKPQVVAGAPWARVQQRIADHQSSVRRREAGSLSVADPGGAGELSPTAEGGALSPGPAAGRRAERNLKTRTSDNGEAR